MPKDDMQRSTARPRPRPRARAPDHMIWALAQLRPNHRVIACANLARQGFSVFLPVHEVTRRRGSRFETVQRPLFPGYVFVGQNTTAPDWSRVNGTRGITRLVRFGERPVLVPPGLVEALRSRFAGLDCGAAPDKPRPGDRVAIVKGPFAEFAARIVALAPDRRVWVLIDLMGRMTRVAVDRAALRPA